MWCMQIIAEVLLVLKYIYVYRQKHHHLICCVIMQLPIAQYQGLLS